MPRVAYLLTLINVVLLVFGLTLGWRWWRQNAKGEA
jgi:predicted negative regulator of RcsB-dependent stress response